MKTTLNLHDFRDAFRTYDRDNFSYNGLAALFEYFEEYEKCCELEIELDVVAICCEYAEYNTALEALLEYEPQFDTEGDEDHVEDLALDYLIDHTHVLQFEGGIIVQSF